MAKIKNIVFRTILALLIIVPVLVSAQSVHRTNCCLPSRDIELDNVDICAGANGQPAGCDPATNPNCCSRYSTFTFYADHTVGPIEPGEVNCYIGETLIHNDIPTPHWGMVCLINSIMNITDAVFWFAMALSIIIGIIAGFNFMTAGGEPYKVEQAKKMFNWLIVGIVVAVASKLITSLIISLLF